MCEGYVKCAAVIPDFPVFTAITQPPSRPQATTRYWECSVFLLLDLSLQLYGGNESHVTDNCAQGPEKPARTLA